MRLQSSISTILALVGIYTVNAQYFSDGWVPGQTVTQETASAPTYVPGQSDNDPAGAASKSPADLTERILSWGPIATLFERAGINITERLEQQKITNIWDSRIPLITDDNYVDEIVKEVLTPEEENERVWVLVISTTSARQDGISKYTDIVFDAAYNETVIAGDLPNIRWGRIDYLNVTMITTKWGVWHAPYIVILRERGQELRFYRAQNLRLKSDALREFLLTEGWKHTPPWQSIYGPGGEREWVFDYLAIALTKTYNVAVKIPRWMFWVFSGTIGSFVIGLLHRPSKQDKAKAEAEAGEKVSKSSTPSTPSRQAASKPQTPAQPDVRPDTPQGVSTSRTSTPQPNKSPNKKRKGRK